MSSMNNFFYWGLNPILSEIDDDILVGLIQRKKSLFYNRGYGAGIQDYENAPISIVSAVLMKYEAVKFMATRNAVVTDGNNGPDRRAASSQDIVTVTSTPDGNVNVDVGYILMADMTKRRAVTVPAGGVK